MSNYKVGLFMGIGDVLMSRVTLDAVRRRYNRISVSPSPSLINAYRNRPGDYRRFIDEWMSVLFGAHPYEIHDASYPMLAPETIAAGHGIKVPMPRLAGLLCHGREGDLPQVPYLVIPCKVRGVSSDVWRVIKTEFLQEIRALSSRYLIALVGERNVVNNAENRAHAGSIFSIYQDLVRTIPKESLVDRTQPSLDSEHLCVPTIRRDCLLMNRARAVICVGIGGNFCLALATAKRLVCFRRDENPTLRSMLGPHGMDKRRNDAFFTSNHRALVRELRTLPRRGGA